MLVAQTRAIPVSAGVPMVSALKSFAPARAGVMCEAARRDVAEKAAACRGIFFAAQELAQRQVYGASLERLLERAGEAIDDIDTVLVGLDPVRDASTFAVAAGLQRQLENLQASISDRRRRGAAIAEPQQSRSASKSGPARSAILACRIPMGTGAPCSQQRGLRFHALRRRPTAGHDRAAVASPGATKWFEQAIDETLLHARDRAATAWADDRRRDRDMNRRRRAGDHDKKRVLGVER